MRRYLTSSALKAENRSLKSGFTAIAPPGLELHDHLPHLFQARGRRDGPPEFPVERSVIPAQWDQPGRPEASLLLARHGPILQVAGKPYPSFSCVIAYCSSFL